MSSSYVIPHKFFSYFLIVEAREVLQGMLGARVIGFQDYSYIKHFISSCARVLGVDHTPTGIFLSNSSVFFSVLPIGVDPLRVQTFLESEKRQGEDQEFEGYLQGKVCPRWNRQVRASEGSQAQIEWLQDLFTKVSRVDRKGTRARSPVCRSSWFKP